MLESPTIPRIILLTGVAGCGKSTVGTLLAERLNWRFCDADDFHPPDNIRKMASGQPLEDEDRAPWLRRMRHELIEPALQGSPLVLACSALKSSYRLALRSDDPRVAVVFLHGDPELLHLRLANRKNHYMRPDLLASQFAALEPPSATEALCLPVTLTPREIIERIVDSFFLEL